jgi:exopolysaccharide/PEP-CTERM locus tyrosine autokinase
MSRIEAAMAKSGKLRRKSAAYPPFPERSLPVDVSDHQYKSVAADINFLSPRLVSINNFNMAIGEEYRKLKSLVIQMTRAEGLPEVIMVTSCISGEGKSITSLNLALSLAQEMDQRVLLIDADIRNPSIGRYLGLPKFPGLVECLEDDVPLDDVLLNTGLGDLIFLPAGRMVANPVELLSSQKMKNLFAEIKSQFADCFIIIDISPVLPFAEARVVSDLADSVVFVVKEGGCNMKNVNEALEILSNVRILGIVYNKAATANLFAGYQYYYYDYEYSTRNKLIAPGGSWKDRIVSLFKK